MPSVLPAISFVASSKDVARRPAAHRARKLHCNAVSYHCNTVQYKLYCTLHTEPANCTAMPWYTIAILCSKNCTAPLHTGPANCTLLCSTSSVRMCTAWLLVFYRIHSATLLFLPLAVSLFLCCFVNRYF